MQQAIERSELWSVTCTRLLIADADLLVNTPLPFLDIETSARTGQNVEKAFEELVRLIRRDKKDDPALDGGKASGGKRTCIFL